MLSPQTLKLPLDPAAPAQCALNTASTNQQIIFIFVPQGSAGTSKNRATVVSAPDTGPARAGENAFHEPRVDASGSGWGSGLCTWFRAHQTKHLRQGDRKRYELI